MKSLLTIPTGATVFTALLASTTSSFAENLQLQSTKAPAVLNSTAPLKLEDIQGPVTIAEPINWLLYSAICLTVLCLLAMIWWFIKRPKPGPPSPSSAQVALQQIEQISGLQQEDPLLYVAQISLITRGYIEKRFAISSSQTTSQFFQSLQTNKHIPKEYNQEFFRKFFGLFDMTKFAKRPPTPEEIHSIEQAIRDFITQGGDNALS